MTTRNETLAQWEAREADIRGRMAPAGYAAPDQLKAASGLEFLQGIMDGQVPPALMGETLDFLPVEAEAGRVVFQGRPSKKHYNPLGSVHGGFFCTLLDSALGCAVHSVLPKGTGYTTVEIKVNLTRAMTDKSGLVRAEAKVIQVGSRIGIAEGRIYDAEGKLYAHATTTCLIFPLP